MKYLRFLLVFISFSGFAQVGGEQVYSFLNFSTSARQTALGGSVLTLTDDVNQALWNPAAISKKIDNQFSFNYVNYLLEINYLSATYAYTFNDHINTFQTGITYLNYGTFIASDENGVETGTFKAYDLAFSIGYAYQIPHSDFHFGINAKIINSVIEQYTSFGIAADIGVLYESEHKPYRMAFVVRNVGLQLKTYDGIKEPIPMQIQLGGSYQLEHVPIRIYANLDNLQKWQLAYNNPSDNTTNLQGEILINEPSFFDNLMRHVVVGAELFPDKGFTLRAGFNVQRSKELKLNNIRTFAGISLGFGLKVKRLKLNYAFSKFHPVADSHSFSLGINLN